jgi:hypothetical protein
MTRHGNSDPTTGPGTTDDPNQSTNADPETGPDDGVPETPQGPRQTNPDPSTGPGTTQDPNQADRT